MNEINFIELSVSKAHRARIASLIAGNGKIIQESDEEIAKARAGAEERIAKAKEAIRLKREKKMKGNL